ncbi:MAG: divalent-cation tolerance protein CutA, partial [Thermoanaerobaculia bacterium]
MKPVLVLTTVGADFNVRAIAHDLVQRRLVACINIVDGLHSIYSWEGRVTEDREQLLIMKTIESRIAELREALFAQHPYEV